MISVEQLIGELLFRHNCVIIPSFGGFVAKQTPASIDYKNGVMMPPRKSLLFNRQLINNDGLLIAELAVANSVNYESASQSINELVTDWYEKLKVGERITIDKVGFLFFDQEKNICFEQDRFFNLLLESYGLEKVVFLTESDVQFAQKTTIERSNEEKNVAQSAIVFNTESITQEHKTAETVIIQHPALKQKPKVWKYVAAACLLPIAFYSFWLPMKTNVLESGMISVKDFNPFYKTGESIYTKQHLKTSKPIETERTLEELVAELPEDVVVYRYQFDEDLYIPIRIHSKNDIDKELVTIENPVVNTANFEYIVGCFGNRDNAENLVAALKSKGLNAYIYDESKGLSRVSAGNAVSDSDLQKLVEKANSAGANGWVLKK